MKKYNKKKIIKYHFYMLRAHIWKKKKKITWKYEEMQPCPLIIPNNLLSLLDMVNEILIRAVSYTK